MSIKYISKALPQMESTQGEVCRSCAGSGHYDHNGSPKCQACAGTGKETD